ncbi:MAG TPA: hypothetical protein VK989_06785, partial [Polyangia bacterium]|nr:hypothetical protein [Polyangia bacterium]
MQSPRKNPFAVALAMTALASSFAACTKSEPGAPAGVPPLPNAPAAAPPAAPAAPPPVAAPPAAAPPAAEKPADPNAKIAGEVVVPAAMRAHVAATDTIFIVARRIPDNPTARGSLVAVKKVSAAKFPLAFELSAADMPFQNGAFDGDLQLSVRDSKSGDPIVRRKGDVFGMLPKVRVGARDVKLPLEQLQKED